MLSTSNLLNFENFAMLVDFSHFFIFSCLRHEDELSTIIAYSLASQEYHDKLQVLGLTFTAQHITPTCRQGQRPAA